MSLHAPTSRVLVTGQTRRPSQSPAAAPSRRGGRLRTSEFAVADKGPRQAVPPEWVPQLQLHMLCAGEDAGAVLPGPMAPCDVQLCMAHARRASRPPPRACNALSFLWALPAHAAPTLRPPCAHPNSLAVGRTAALVLVAVQAGLPRPHTLAPHSHLHCPSAGTRSGLLVSRSATKGLRIFRMLRDDELLHMMLQGEGL